MLLLIILNPILKSPDQIVQIQLSEIKAKVNNAQFSNRSVKDSNRKFSKLDFRPSYMKGGFLFSKEVTQESPTSAAQILNTPFKVLQAFDNLASQINSNLDYPDLLFEG